MKSLIFPSLIIILVLSCEKCKPPLENTPPVITAIRAYPDSVFPGDTVVLSFDYTDAEGDSISIQWSSQVGSFTPNPFTRTAKWITPKIPGEYFIQLRISNPRDSITDTDSIRIVVIDRPGTFTDIRDGHVYKWVKIGNQVWMTENLAYLPWVSSLLGNPSGYYIYGVLNGDPGPLNRNPYYMRYGVLYGLESAQIVCPAGWHLSTDEEWKTLEIFLGMDPAIAERGNRHGLSTDVAKSLMSDILWSGNNSSGVNAVPGGTISYYARPGYESWSFVGAGVEAVYLSPSNSAKLYRIIYSYNDSGKIDVGIDRVPVDDLGGFSVRCLKN